jgi:hypothetical protein
MFIVTPETVWNAAALETRQLPRRFIGRVTLWPRRGGSWGLFARTVFEVEVLRYTSSLLPFIAAALIWQDKAVVIAQAPLLMFMVVYLVETRVLRPSAERRKGLVDRDEADRALDTLRVRARSILTRIAAGRSMADGTLWLVVEQSELARVAPLTYVSVQSEMGPEVLRLSPGEERMIRETLFRPPLDERLLHRVNMMEDEFLREIRLDARTVSAHARMEALLSRQS